MALEKMKPIRYGSTEQFRNVVKQVNEMAAYMGKDESGNVVKDYSQPKPILKFNGSVKLHGTNASVVVTTENKIYTQSRNGIFDPYKQPDSHMGFTQFILSDYAPELEENFTATRADYILGCVLNLRAYRSRISESIEGCDVIVYGEWAGKGIQAKVAISELEKAFYIFGVKIKPLDGSDSFWIPVNEVKSFFPTHERTRNVWDYSVWNIDIDFENPALAQNIIIKITEEIEKECPIAKAHGVSGVGEGIVFVGEYEGQRLIFKSKGEKHAKGSKPKVLKEVDVDALNAEMAMADKVTPVWRLAQFYDEMAKEQSTEVLERKFLGEYINRIKADIVKEEMDVVLESGVEFKRIIKHLGTICREYYFNREKL